MSCYVDYNFLVKGQKAAVSAAMNVFRKYQKAYPDTNDGIVGWGDIPAARKIGTLEKVGFWLARSLFIENLVRDLIALTGQHASLEIMMHDTTDDGWRNTCLSLIMAGRRDLLGHWPVMVYMDEAMTLHALQTNPTTILMENALDYVNDVGRTLRFSEMTAIDDMDKDNQALLAVGLTMLRSLRLGVNKTGIDIRPQLVGQEGLDDSVGHLLDLDLDDEDRGLLGWLLTVYESAQLATLVERGHGQNAAHPRV